jgi:hypothetical protein
MSTLKEYASASVTLLVILAGLGGIIWLANSCRPGMTKTVCPYCGKTVIVKLETNGEEKQK